MIINSLPRSHTSKTVKTNKCPLPSSHFQNEAKCKTFLLKMNFICMRRENHFHIIGFALSCLLSQRHGATRNWPVDLLLNLQSH